MTIRIYYRRKDFFGKIVDAEDTLEPMTADDAKYGRNHDEPQKMTAAAIRRIALYAVESCVA